MNEYCNARNATITRGLAILISTLIDGYDCRNFSNEFITKRLKETISLTIRNDKKALPDFLTMLILQPKNCNTYNSEFV